MDWCGQSAGKQARAHATMEIPPLGDPPRRSPTNGRCPYGGLRFPDLPVFTEKPGRLDYNGSLMGRFSRKTEENDGSGLG